ncbi:hypothetical protein ACIBEJ_09980 [Nonomuraea sp. NPDC050790]|uniref:hypothetical protein n=1 Tax=Nonomuraea sp. NPDC050790 TaxID=3364371 RepID=UPI0037A1B033
MNPRAALRAIAGHELPPPLEDVLDRLAASAWPEVAWRWSRLTPSGFPVELTPGPDGLSWAAEVAPPEFPDADRLGAALRLLEKAGQPCLEPLPGRSASARFGAWIGGKPDGRLKVYAELADTPLLQQRAPSGGRPEPVAATSGGCTEPVAAARGDLSDLAETVAVPRGGRSEPVAVVASGGPVVPGSRGGLPYLLPEAVGAVVGRLPDGARPRMAGVEPRTGKTELYFRLPVLEDPLDLLPLLLESGHAAAVRALEEHLPGGLGRLRGRRLGLSVAWHSGSRGRPRLALFASARTLFPEEPEPSPGVRRGLVTLALDPEGLSLPVAVALSPVPARP